jgi:CheY-like chemotaxis protein
MLRITVIDDDPEMGRLLKTLFELEGYQVTSASKYQDVLPTITRAEPDVVLMDVRVQGKETIDLMRQMSQDKTMASIPVVMTSGMDRKEACLAAGAKAFVLKPFLPSEMTRMVTELLGEG